MEAILFIISQFVVRHSRNDRALKGNFTQFKISLSHRD
jgi:hypothetical protein